MTGEEEPAYLREFGHRVRVQRVISGDLTQEQIAARAGLSRDFVGAVERGESDPSLLRTRRLAVALGVPLAVLTGDQVEGLPS
jgi:transcriptional regulator with XRE-family HTH domain